MAWSVQWDDRAALAAFELAVVEMLKQAGSAGLGRARQLTPRRSGYAANSLFYVIRNAAGQVVGGDSTDANGTPVPTSFPGSEQGWIELILGANADYFIWIEIGTATRPARNVLSQTLAYIANDLRGQLSAGGVQSTTEVARGAQIDGL